MTERVVWRGVTLDKRTAAMMDEVAALVGDIYVDPSQGSFSGGVGASAGTHDGCGAIDLMNRTESEFRVIVKEMRRVGFAAWVRTPAQSNWPLHVHGIAIQPGGKNDRGCLASGAHSQVVDYFNGLNGLAGKGSDDGPRDFVGATWESYKEGRDWFAMATKAELREVVEQVIDSRLDEIANRVNGTLGDFDAHGKPREGVEKPERANLKLNRIENVVRRVEKKVGA